MDYSEYSARLDALFDAVETVNRRMDILESQLNERDRQDCLRSDSERQPVWPGDPITRRLRRSTFH